MTFFFDTNIFVHYLRESPVYRFIESEYDPLKKGNTLFTSIVNVAELGSLAIQNGWGTARMNKLNDLLTQFVKTEIRFGKIIDHYIQIEAFSQCKLPDLPASHKTPRNMGKNDLWIAATASVLDAPLLTTDHDFDHLDNVFLKLLRISA